MFCPVNIFKGSCLLQSSKYFPILLFVSFNCSTYIRRKELINISDCFLVNFRYGIFRIRFYYFSKMSACVLTCLPVCYTNFEDVLTQELMYVISSSLHLHLV